MVAPFVPSGRRSESRATIRPMLKPWRPCGRPTPQYTSSISSGSTPWLRSSSASTTNAPISSGRSWANEPLKARPMGVRTASTITDSGMARTLLRRHSQGAVQPDRLAVEHLVLGDLAGELGVLLGPSEPRGVRHLGAQRLARLLRQAGEQRCVEQARRNRADANAESREVARGRERKAHDAALRGGVRGLPEIGRAHV